VGEAKRRSAVQQFDSGVIEAFMAWRLRDGRHPTEPHRQRLRRRS